MLKINPNPKFSADVEIHVPGEKPEKVKFTFKHKAQDEYKSFLDRAKNGQASELETLLEIVDGWSGCDVEFSSGALADLLNQYHTAGTAIFATYVNEQVGARLGN